MCCLSICFCRCFVFLGEGINLMKLNKISQLVAIAVLLACYRYICIWLELYLGYFNDVIFILGFGFSMFLYRKWNKESTFVTSFFGFGLLQIICVILLFEITRLLIIQPELSSLYLLDRAVVSFEIILIGIVANIISLSIYSLVRKENHIVTKTNSEPLDN